MSEVVAAEVFGRVLVISIDRPEARNAINQEVATGVAAALDRLEGDPQLAVGVLTGRGGTFSAGMDLKGFLRGESPVVSDRGLAGLTEAPPRTPLIAAVEGWAVAGGFEIVLACDLVVAASDAQFGLPEVKRSLVAAGGGLLRLPRRIPYNVAMELVLTGETFSAQRAHELGLVNSLTEPGQALGAAIELAERVAANGPLALMASKEILRRGMDWSEDQAWKNQAEIAAPVFASADAREGALSFAEKRPPRWQGR